MMLLVDPSTAAINDLIRGLDYAFPEAVKIGGIAGFHNAPHGSLLGDDGVRTGVSGCLIDGNWCLDPVVAQGCRPIGPVFEIEQVERNVLLELSSRGQRANPVTCLQGVLATLSPAERDLVRHSLFLGIGQNDFRLPGSQETDGEGSRDTPPFLVRNLIGVDPRNGAVAVAERVRVGQQVQFQLREATASRQEARALLGARRRSGAEPLAGLLFACLGRGEGLFQDSNGDVTIAAEFHPALPMAGAFCNGEIGPLGGTTHLHGYTACWAMVVPCAEATDGP
jgi:small ligand-binding sensory domain FIST